jgi:hypothetical protein
MDDLLVTIENMVDCPLFLLTNSCGIILQYELSNRGITNKSPKVAQLSQ